jgi:hypothetical protein
MKELMRELFSDDTGKASVFFVFALTGVVFLQVNTAKVTFGTWQNGEFVALRQVINRGATIRRSLGGTDRLQLKPSRVVLTSAFSGPGVKDEAPHYWHALHNLEVNDNCAYADGHLRERCTRRMNLLI